MLELLKREFISKADSPQDYDTLLKTVKGNWLGLSKPLTSKDGNYEIRRYYSGWASLLGRHYLVVHDKRQQREFMFKAHWFGKMKKAVQMAIAEAKMNPV